MKEHRSSRPGSHPVPGGKAQERLSMFMEARGMSQMPATLYGSNYAAGLAQAIALAGQAAQLGSAQPQWNFLGPDLIPGGQVWSTTSPSVTVSGRVGAIAIDPRDKNHLLCGSAAGGIWESFTRGASWAPRTDSMPTLTIGAIAFDPNDPRIVYAGTGEGNSYYTLGQGVLRSGDGGTTWALLTAGPFLGLGFFEIIVDRANSKRLLAATTGGLYQSANSGATWTQVYAAKTWDVSMAPAGGPTAEVLAATANGLVSSTDGCLTWTVQTLPGAPANWNRMAVSIAASDPTRAFAYGAAGSPPVTAYLWLRSGGAWAAITTPPNPDNDQFDQSYYNWYVVNPPDSANQVYVGAFDIMRGDLAAGAWTWTNITSKSDATDSIHPDQHVLVFDNNDPATIYAGCDGGIFRSPDRGNSWVSLNPGLGITEIEYMVNNNSDSRWLLAGTQDNGSMRYQGTSAFECVAVGDGGDCGVDQTNPATCYHSYTTMTLERSATKAAKGSWTAINPQVPSGYSALFYPPMGVCGSTVAQAGASVWISRDTGTSWTEVPLPAAANNARQVTTALCVPTTDLIYAGTQNGRIFKITYANGAWSSPPVELHNPINVYVSAIVADPAPNGRMWATCSTITGAGAFRSDDGGTTWINRSAGLPRIPINSVAVDNTNPDRVWVAADLGVYQSTDGGGTWTAFSQGLPNALAEDLEFQPTARLLRVGTRSRGVWEVAIDSAAPPPGPVACAVAWNNNGGLEAFVVGTDQALWRRYQQAPSVLWETWGSLDAGKRVTSALAVAANTDKSLEVFGRGSDGRLCRIYQTAPAFGWSAWAGLGGVMTGNPTAASNQDGRIDVFARGSDGALWHICQSAAGSWTGSVWSSLGQVITSTPAALLNVDGRMEVFARGTDGTLWHTYQTSAGSTSWSAWETLNGALVGRPSVTTNQDGRAEVFARGTDGAVWHSYQTAPPAAGQTGRPGGSWSAWGSLGGLAAGINLASEPAAIANADGRLEVFARGTDNAMWHVYQNSPNGGWSSWASLGGTFASDPTVWTIQAGGILVFASGPDQSLWHLHQMSASSSTVWSSPWVWVGGTPRALIAFP